jgi:hypothetical protein
MNPRRVAALAALCGTVALESWPAAGLLGFGSLPIENAGASMEPKPIPATSATAGAARIGAAQPAKGIDVVSGADVAIAGAALAVPAPAPPPETRSEQIASITLDAGSPRSENAAASIDASPATSATAGGGPVGETQPAKGEDDVSAANAAVAGAASPAPAAMPAPETSPVQVASADPEAGSLRSENAAASIEASVATSATPGPASPGPAPVPPPETSSVQVASADPEAGLPRSENAAASIEVVPATSATAGVEPDVAAPAVKGERSVSAAEGATAGAASPAAAPVPQPETSVQVASANPADLLPGDTEVAVRPAETPDPCLGAAETCIDQYLWSVYQRAPKVDTIKVSERIKVTVKKKGKTRTVTKTVTRLADEDFTWKDPKAAEKTGMPLMDYVIGGMDRSFRLKLYHALRALDDAGLAPGITSGFRDNYRQSLASGNKAASDSSYHGGSRRGGYGHGLAADLVSVRGETRAQRCSSSEILWKWIDAHGPEFGIARPYLDRDAPHVGPIDGQEYADKRGRARAKLAELDTKRRHRSAASEHHSRAKRQKTASAKLGSI